VVENPGKRMFYFLINLFGIFPCLRGMSHERPEAKVISYQRPEKEGD